MTWVTLKILIYYDVWVAPLALPANNCYEAQFVSEPFDLSQPVLHIYPKPGIDSLSVAFILSLKYPLRVTQPLCEVCISIRRLRCDQNNTVSMPQSSLPRWLLTNLLYLAEARVLVSEVFVTCRKRVLASTDQ